MDAFQRFDEAAGESLEFVVVFWDFGAGVAVCCGYGLVDYLLRGKDRVMRGATYES